MCRLQFVFKTSAQAIELRSVRKQPSCGQQVASRPPAPLPTSAVESVSFVMMRIRGGGGCVCVQFVVRTTQGILQLRLVSKLS